MSGLPEDAQNAKITSANWARLRRSGDDSTRQFHAVLYDKRLL